MRILFNIWIERTITPLGKIAILKSVILSKIVQLWVLQPNPPMVLLIDCKKMCFKFVWNKKQDRISRKTVKKSIQKRIGAT